MNKTQELYKKAKELIPGGTQLLSKRPEMFAPNQWPPYYSKAKGCKVWDLDGNKYYDMTTMGIGSCLLGYADPVVNQAVIEAVQDGVMSTLNSPQEVELAELLIELHPWAEMVRYARSGGEIMSVAIRIARAASGKDKIAFCGYHGWHDWYLAANLGGEDKLDGQLLPGLEPKGVPKALTGTIHPFHYNTIEELENIVEAHGPEIGVIVMEPFRYRGPENGFLEKVKQIASRLNAVLIFDEITSGWRHHLGGVHMKLGVKPDMAVFAKAISNGFPMGAVIGRREVMDAAQESFISSTYWTDRTGPTAALTTIKQYRDRDVPSLVAETGKKVHSLWNDAAQNAGLSIEIEGPPALSHFSFSDEKDGEMTTLLVQEMLKRGIFGNTAFYTSAAHNEEALSAYEKALHEVFPIIKGALENGTVKEKLLGPVRHRGFTRLT
jgi:glutamate-1-semialdehyde 2,1-aminomutase